MKELSEQLRSVIEAAEPRLRQISEAESEKPVLSGGWSRKEVMGHLIDSASNNHQRFVRAALQSSLDFPGYDQDGNTRVQAPKEANWLLLVSLWAAYNRYLAHIIARLPFRPGREDAAYVSVAGRRHKSDRRSQSVALSLRAVAHR
ncbi:MAG: hypothetical protein ABSF93_13035, partial [Candidatus Sulfotelmatobacter sp.]